MTFEHDNAWIKSQISKSDINAPLKRWLLATVGLQDTELQQLDLCTIEKIVQFDLHGYEAQGFRKGVAWLKKEILGENQQEEPCLEELEEQQHDDAYKEKHDIDQSPKGENQT